MAQQVINIGTAPNSGDGDVGRTVCTKINDNFTELYAGAGGLTEADIFGSSVINAADYATLNLAFADVVDGSILLMPAAAYTVTSAIVCNKHSVRVIGQGAQNWYSGSYFGTRIISQVDAGVCLKFNNTAAGIHQGPHLSNITFVDDTTSSDGTMLELADVSRWVCENVTCRPTDPASSNEGGTGIKISKSGGSHNSWGLLHQCHAIGFDIGFHFAGGDGHTMQGGSAVANGATQIGFKIDSGSLQNVFQGVRFDGTARTGTGWAVYSDYNTFLGYQVENCEYCFDFFSGAVGNQIGPGHGDNIEYGIRFQSGADNNKVIMPTFSSVNTTRFVNSGTSNSFVTAETGITLDHAFAGGIGWTDSVKLYRNAGTPESAVTAPIGSMCVDTSNGVLYMKKSGAGNTGWKLVTQAA